MGRVYKRGSVWYADYMDADGCRIRKNTKMRDKQSANKVLLLWEGGERRIEIGLDSRSQDGEPIEFMLVRFITAKQSSGRSGQHIDRTVQLIRAVVAHNKWKILRDINAEGINKYGQHLLTDAEHASRTVSSMVTAIRTFCRWCVRNGILLGDPTAVVEKPSAKTDRRIERRMLLPTEWHWIKQAMATDTIRNGQNSQERLLMYRVAIETGLRSSELRSLQRSSLVLDGLEPHIVVKASLTKNAQQAKQYLSDGLAQSLRDFVARKMPGVRVFNVASRTEMARTLRSDVEEARALWLKTKEGKKLKGSDFLATPNSQGEVIDFHALRHTCGAWLVQQGVTLAEVREIMRHSTITLTVDCYGHLAPDARSRSRSVLGAMLG
jgi:integrase